jgi:hypothetical protein
MFQPKARRVVPVLALTAALSLLPLADASAARAHTARPQQPARMFLLAQIEVQLTSFWTVLEGIWDNSGSRMDDNG